MENGDNRRKWEIYKQVIKEQNDYNISIDAITYDNYNRKIKDKTLSLNGSYDMVILGFQDQYGIKAVFEKEGIEELKKFIASGQSVMFTHDSIPGYSGYDDKNLAAAFRTYVGQARFLPSDTLPIDINPNLNNYKYVEPLYKELTGEVDANNKLVYSNPIPMLDNNKKLVKGYSFWSSKTSTRQKIIYETNEGLITNYPFNITGNDNKFMEVANTHHQYFQLNFEDEDVIPWYNLTDYLALNNSNSDNSKVNKYDSRNFYYTYSKGNITYSGTGHSGVYTTDELKLFVNTIVKAERGANHAPTLESNVIVDNKKNYDLDIDSENDFKFTVIPKDIDNDNVKVSYKVYLEGATERIVQNGEFEFQKQGTSRDIVLNSDGWSKNTGKIVYVEAQVEDVRGAKNTQIYRFNPTKTSINISGIGEELVGKEITVKLNINKSENVSLTNILSEENGRPLYDDKIFKDLKINKINEDEYQVTLKTETEMLNSIISLKAKYTININDTIEKEHPFGIIINTKMPVVEVKVIDLYKELGKDIPEVKLSKANKELTLKSGEVKVWTYNELDLLSKGETYSVKLDKEDVNNKITSKIKIDKSEALTDYNLGDDFNISYDKPKAYIEISIEKKVKEISHGLYAEVKDNNFMLSESNVNLVRDSMATVGVAFRVASSDVNFGVQIDENITNNEILGLYKIEDKKIKKIGGADQFNIVGNKATVKLPAGITSDTKLMILYKSQIPLNTNNENKVNTFTNKLFIENEDVKGGIFTIDVTKNTDGNVTDIPLPDLF